MHVAEDAEEIAAEEFFHVLGGVASGHECRGDLGEVGGRVDALGCDGNAVEVGADADMVDAEYLLIKEGLGIRHLRLVTGNSMGGMETWLWGEKYPDFMDALAPMASQPTPMAMRSFPRRHAATASMRRLPIKQTARKLQFKKTFDCRE